MSSAPPRLSKRNFAIVFAVSCSIQIGNTGLTTVLPPISRSLGLMDEMAVAVFALSALMFAVMSTRWAKASRRYGQKRIMMVGMTGFLISMTLFGVVVSIGLRHLLPPVALFVCLLLARSLFGLLGSAANPTSQSYVADRTHAEERTKAMASLAGAVGLGQVIGPVLAPLFILPGVGLAGPLFGFAALAAGVLAALTIWLPSDRNAPVAVARPSSSTQPELPSWKDPRIKPFLIYGFLAVASQVGLQQVIGFVVLDKLHLGVGEVQHFLAIIMMFGAVAGLLAQWGLIRMFSMTPRALLRWGVAVAASGNLAVAFAPNYFWLVVGYAIASLGFGLVRPGFTAGASISVASHDQARVAGAIAAVTGVSGLFAPGFMWMYRHAPAAPFLFIMTLMLALLAYSFFSQAVKNATPQSATQDDATVATLERADEGA